MAKKLLDQEIDKHVGARVRMRRMMLSMSQEKLADALGLTFQQVQKYEKGKNRIGSSRLVAIARILDVQPAFFFEGIAGVDSQPGTPQRGSLVAAFFSLPHATKLAEHYVALASNQDRLLLVGVAGAMAHDPEPVALLRAV